MTDIKLELPDWMNPKPKEEVDLTVEIIKLKGELKYQKDLLAEYRRAKKKQEPIEVKTYITNQKINGRNYKRTQKTKKYTASYHEKKLLRRELCDLINDYDDIEVLKAIKDVLTDHTDQASSECVSAPPNSPDQSPPALIMQLETVQQPDASTLLNLKLD